MTTLPQRSNSIGRMSEQGVGSGVFKMTEIDVDKDEAFKAIKDSIPPEFEDPTEEQQEALDAEARRFGFVKAANPEPESEAGPVPEPELPIQKMESMDEWRTVSADYSHHIIE